MPINFSHISPHPNARQSEDFHGTFSRDAASGRHIDKQTARAQAIVDKILSFNNDGNPEEAQVIATLKEYPALALRAGELAKLQFGSTNPQLFNRYFPDFDQNYQQRKSDIQQKLRALETAQTNSRTRVSVSSAPAVGRDPVLEGYVARNGFDLKRVDPDGNCLYASLTDSRDGIAPLRARVKQALAWMNAADFGGTPEEFIETAERGWAGRGGDVTAELAMIEYAKATGLAVVKFSVEHDKQLTQVYAPDGNGGVEFRSLGATNSASLREGLRGLGIQQSRVRIICYSGARQHYDGASPARSVLV